MHNNKFIDKEKNIIKIIEKVFFLENNYCDTNLKVIHRIENCNKIFLQRRFYIGCIANKILMHIYMVDKTKDICVTKILEIIQV